MELWHYGALIAAGIVGGAINVMAGGGSVITVPVMVFLGVPGPIANGTNRSAILAQNLTAVGTFMRGGQRNFRLSISLALCALPGALLGAWTGVQLSGAQFNAALAAVMLATLVLMYRGGATTQAGDRQPKNLLWGHLLMVFAGFWGGFIQIGVGFILMPILNRVMGLDLVSTNAHKCFIVAVYTLGALVVFSLQSEVLWLIGAVLAIGNSLGGYLGAKLTLTQGEGLIRKVLALAIIGMVIKLLFFP